MSLYLVQHGAAFPKERDPERRLTPEGIADVERIAEVARGYEVKVSTIHHSGKQRAVQTAQIIERILEPGNGCLYQVGLDPLDEVSALAERLDPRDDLMIVGHLPFLERLVSLLVGGNQEFPVIQMQNGGIVCLDEYEQTGRWTIKWALMPRIG